MTGRSGEGGCVFLVFVGGSGWGVMQTTAAAAVTSTTHVAGPRVARLNP